MHIAERMTKMQASGIRKIFDMAATLKAPINLSIGQPHFDVSEPVKEAAIKAIRDGKNSYAPARGIPALCDKVSAWFRKRGVLHEDVIVTAGASGALTLAILAVAGPGDEVIIFDPYFVSYKQLTLAAGAKPVFCPTYPEFIPDCKRLETLITKKTAAIILNSPCNPTGAVFGKETVTEISRIAAKHGVTIISDEVYDCFHYETVPFSPGTLQPDVITINGLSKSSSMTGWRLGFACGPASLVAEMTKLQQFTFVNAPQPVQWAALIALDEDTSAKRAEYRKKRDMLVSALKDAFDIAAPPGAFYVFPRVPVRGMTGTEFCTKAIEKNVLTVPGAAFSERDSHFRISYAVRDETLQRGAEILTQLAQELSSKRKRCRDRKA